MEIIIYEFQFQTSYWFKYLQIYDNSDVQYMVNGFEDDEDFINFDLALDETPCQTISPVIVHTTETQFEHEYAAVEDTVNAIHRYEEPPGEESY